MFRVFASGVVMLFVVSIVLVLLSSLSSDATAEGKPGSPGAPSQEAMEWCSTRFKQEGWYQTTAKEAKPRTKSTKKFVLRKVTVWDGTGTDPQPDMDLLVENGKIVAIGKDLKVGGDVEERALPSRPAGGAEATFVTPGIVDMHSHAGVYPFPVDLFSNDDGNEMTQPTTPFVRAVDSLDPQDIAFRQILEGGITTQMVIPGSGNVIGGEGLVIKLVKSLTVSKMIVEDAPRLVKMATGENARRVYGKHGRMPMTRMGVTYLMRTNWEKATRSLASQREYCRKVDAGEKVGDLSSVKDIDTDALVGILLGFVKLNIHTYQTQEMETLMRVGEEFGFDVAAFHHGLEAYLIADLVAKKNVTVATFSDLWAYKWEAIDGSVCAPKKLYEAGVRLALKSDHPVLHATNMMAEGAKASYYGLNPNGALKALTLNPAISLGISHRVGSLEVGKDADIVLWDGNPITKLGSRPREVFIEGENVVKATTTNPYDLTSHDTKPPQNPPVAAGPKLCGNESNSYFKDKDFKVTGLRYIHTVDSADKPRTIENGEIYVKDGMVECVDTSCPAPANTLVFDQPGGVAIPGLIESGSVIGEIEIPAEEVTTSGSAADGTPLAEAATIKALDGIRLRSRHQKSAMQAGITRAVTDPTGSGLIAGLSSAMCLHGDFIVRETSAGGMRKNVILEEAGLVVNIGNDAKGDKGSIGGQMAALRVFFSLSGKPSESTTKLVGRLKDGTLPLVAKVNQADEMMALLELKREVGIKRLVLEGAAEVTLIIPALKATTGVSVILKPARCIPKITVEAFRCTGREAVELHKAGIQFAIQQEPDYDTDNPRNLRWEAGFLVTQGVPYQKAIYAITKAASDIYLGGAKGVGSILKGTPAHFGVFTGNPLSYNGKPALVVADHMGVCNPNQYFAPMLEQEYF